MLEDICTTGIKENASIITLIKLIGKKTTKHLSIGSKNYKKNLFKFKYMKVTYLINEQHKIDIHNFMYAPFDVNNSFSKK